MSEAGHPAGTFHPSPRDRSELAPYFNTISLQPQAVAQGAYWPPWLIRALLIYSSYCDLSFLRKVPEVPLS